MTASNLPVHVPGLGTASGPGTPHSNGKKNGNGRRPGQFENGNTHGATPRHYPRNRPIAVAKESGRWFGKALGFEVLAGIISGDILEQVGVTPKGVPIYGQTKNRDRIEAAKLLLHYHVGKPAQIIGVVGGADAERVARAVFFLPQNGRK